MDHKKTLLAALLIVLSAALIYRVTHPFKQERVRLLTYSNKGHSGIVTMKIVPPVKVKFDDKKNFNMLADRFFNPPNYQSAVKKNPFFERQYVPPPAQEQVKPPEPPKKEEINPLDIVRQDIAGLKVFGTYESLGKKAIFFQRGKELLIVREGDRIDGKYLVQEISDDSITIKAEKLDETVHIDTAGF